MLLVTKEALVAAGLSLAIQEEQQDGAVGGLVLVFAMLASWRGEYGEGDKVETEGVAGEVLKVHMTCDCCVFAALLPCTAPELATQTHELVCMCILPAAWSPAHIS